MFCTNCGRAIPEGSRFCVACGAPAEEPLDVPEDVSADTSASVPAESFAGPPAGGMPSADDPQAPLATQQTEPQRYQPPYQPPDPASYQTAVQQQYPLSSPPQYQQPVPVQPQYTQPVVVYQVPVVQPVYTVPYPAQEYAEPEVPSEPEDPFRGHSMKWHKFLVYFSLFAAALASLVLGLQAFSRAYSLNRVIEQVGIIKNLQTMLYGDVIYGVLQLIAAGLAINARQKLIRLQKKGRSALVRHQFCLIVAEFVWMITAAVLAARYGVVITITANAIAVAALFVLLLCNASYYGKRKDIFVN